MAWLSVVRLITFVMVVMFSAVVLALSVDLITIFEPFYLKFTALAIATGGLTLLTVIPMFFIDVVQQCRGNIIILDIVWLSILWALWLASGSYTVWTYTQLFDLVQPDPLVSSCNFFDPLVTKVCQEIKVMMFLSFPASIFLMVYTGILLFVAILAQNRGHNVWGKSVREPAIFYPKGIYSAQVPTIPAGFPQAYPPYAYPPHAYPPHAYPPHAYPPQAYPPQAYPPQAYPPQTYPPQTYPPQTYPPQTYPPQTSPPQTSSPALTPTSGAIQV